MHPKRKSFFSTIALISCSDLRVLSIVLSLSNFTFTSHQPNHTHSSSQLKPLSCHCVRRFLLPLVFSISIPLLIRAAITAVFALTPWLPPGTFPSSNFAALLCTLSLACSECLQLLCAVWHSSAPAAFPRSPLKVLYNGSSQENNVVQMVSANKQIKHFLFLGFYFFPEKQREMETQETFLG